MAEKSSELFSAWSRVFNLKSTNHLIILVFVLIISLVYTVKPSDETEGSERMSLLKMFLNKDPLSLWLYKDRFPTLRHLHLPKDFMNKSIKIKENPRIENILRKATRGEDIKVVVIGGSNTAGGGLQEEEQCLNGTYFNILNDWWKKTITTVTGSKLQIKVIAIGGTSSSFYQFCYKVYMEDSKYDLAIIELSINDARAVMLPNINRTLPMEQLTRQLMGNENHPALLYINLFSIKFPELGCFNLMDFGQSLLCDHYKITSFNLRDTSCELRNDGRYNITTDTLKSQSIDHSHTNLLGHAQTALMLVNFISGEILKMMQGNGNPMPMEGQFKIILLPPLPSPVYINGQDNIINRPLCWTTLTTNWDKRIHNSLSVIVLKKKGFFKVRRVMIGGIKYLGTVYRSDAYSGWGARKKDAEINLSFIITPDQANSSRSVGLVTRMSLEGGEIKVWMDDRYNKHLIIPLKSNFRQTRVSIVAIHVSHGRHTLNVRIIKNGVVPLIGIVIGPADGPY